MIDSDAFLDALGHIQTVASQTEALHREVLKLLEPNGIPVRGPVTRTLTQAQPRVNDFMGAEQHMRSFTIITPNIALALGLDGASPDGGNGFVIPAGSWITVPSRPDGLQLAANNAADLAAGDAVVHLFMYPDQRPFHMERIS